jgi:hypothetical protein
VLASALLASASAQTSLSAPAAQSPTPAQQALQLALQHLEAGDRSAARAPARQALELSQLPESGVDPTVAQIVRDRSELRRESRSRNDRLLELLREAWSRPEIAPHVNAAAIDLAAMEQADGRYQRAAFILAIVAEHPEGATGHPRLARARALIGQAENLAYSSAVKRQREVLPDEVLAHQLLHDAGREAAHVAHEQQISRSESVTDAHRVLALATAWHGALTARVTHLDAQWVDEPSFLTMSSEGLETRRYCEARLIAEPRPDFAARAYSQSRVGSVVVIISVDDDYKIVGREIAASAPSGEYFDDVIEAVYSQWRVERAADAPADCTVWRHMMQPLIFGYRE